MLIQTDSLDAAKLRSLDEPTTHQLYCGLDCCLTLEVFEELSALCTPANASEPEWPVCYSFERALQAPALDMMLRGFKIDQYARYEGIEKTKAESQIIRAQLDELAESLWGKGLNPGSHKQLKEFFYGALRLPPVVTSIHGEKKTSLNRESLEKLEQYFHARPIVALIIEARDLAKRLSVLETEISPDGRMRTSYNIGGTNTGRWSSSSDVTGAGTNLQNITPELRRMFVADRGWKLCGIDLEQAESREVGWLCGTLFGDWRYLDACEGGDLHTTTAKLIWPDLGWQGSSKEDRVLAEQIFYRGFSYRDMSKRGGHGSNYLGTPWTMARHLKVPVALMENFQTNYFEAFPAIPRWHQWVAERLQLDGALVTPFGRKRQFFGRRDDDTTLRKAIAFSPQSSTGDRLNLGLWRIWQHMPDVQLLAQVHDAVYFQYPDTENSEREAEYVQRALRLVETTLSTRDRRFTVPGEATVGWNWAKADPKCKLFSDGNPEGLTKWSATLPNTRKRRPDMERTL
jgi:DNA polymerase I-like protein with 3'-5' exonuclease and polymerase domains